MLETIQQSAISHDRHQVELKLDYQLDRGKETRYHISTYIFVPRSLGITEESYPKNEIYRDIKNYIRIKTPQMSLRDLIDDDVSPFSVVQQIIHQPGWYWPNGFRSGEPLQADAPIASRLHKPA